MYYMSVVGSNIFHTRLSVDDESIRILRNGSSPGSWAGAGVLKSIRILGWVDPMPRCTQCNRHWLEALQAGPLGRHWELECQPIGWHWNCTGHWTALVHSGASLQLALDTGVPTKRLRNALFSFPNHSSKRP